jgi:hypothetical protein
VITAEYVNIKIVANPIVKLNASITVLDSEKAPEKPNMQIASITALKAMKVLMPKVDINASPMTGIELTWSLATNVM